VHTKQKILLFSLSSTFREHLTRASESVGKHINIVCALFNRPEMMTLEKYESRIYRQKFICGRKKRFEQKSKIWRIQKKEEMRLKKEKKEKRYRYKKL
jgi:hypothetical protein